MLEHIFLYDEAGILSKIRIGVFRPDEQRPGADATASTDWLGNLVAQERRRRLHDWLGKRSLPLELFCGCDQVGTLKTLTDKSGALVKEVVRDSFGVQLHDSFPDLFIPIGFAGGLADPDTGLVRFGYRDYDPSVGRFTAPDPLGDTGGDHDLYDYCIDDPVTMNDPSGLFPPLLLFLGFKALALGIAAAGSYASAKVVDKIKSARDGKESTDAVDALKKIAPAVGMASGLSAVPGVLAMGPGAMAAGGAALHASKYGDKIINAAPKVKDFIEGAVLPGPPAMTRSGAAGYFTGELYKKATEGK